MHPTNPDLLFAAVRTPNQTRGGVYVSPCTGGDSWSSFPALRHGQAVETPKKPDVGYGARELPRTAATTPVRRGRVRGGTLDRPAGVPIDLQADPRDPLRIFDNNYAGGNCVSEDGGDTLVRRQHRLRGSSTVVVNVEPETVGLYVRGTGAPTAAVRWQKSALPSRHHLFARTRPALH